MNFGVPVVSFKQFAITVKIQKIGPPEKML